VHGLARFLSILVTLVAASAAALIVLPPPHKQLALLTVVVHEKPFWLIGAALLGTLLARFSQAGGWIPLQGLLTLATIGLSIIPPVQGIRMAARTHVPLDFPRYLKAPIDWESARPAQTLVYATVDGHPLLLDVYRPTAPTKRVPAVIVVHGGGWSADDKGDAPRASAWLAAHGYAVFDIQYRTSPQPNWKTALGDVKCAIGWVKRRAAALDRDPIDVDPARVALLGRSAGGHLALLAAYTPDDPVLPPSCDAGDTRVASVISFYGFTDLTWAYEHPGNARVFDTVTRLRNFLGSPLADAPERYRLMSPASRVVKGAPRTLLVHGARDHFVSVDNVERLASRLRELDVPHETLVIPYAEHAFDFVHGGLSGQLAEHAVLATLSAR
jgi:acetyl esterase/lipase